MSSAPADAMTDVTQVVLLSVCLELPSEYAELFLDIFCGLSHSVPVKVASRSIPGGETARQQTAVDIVPSYAGKTTGGNEHNSTASQHAGGCFYMR